jgi:hypothetical protein
MAQRTDASRERVQNSVPVYSRVRGDGKAAAAAGVGRFRTFRDFNARFTNACGRGVDGFGAEHREGFVLDVAALAGMIYLTWKVHGRKASSISSAEESSDISIETISSRARKPGAT